MSEIARYFKELCLSDGTKNETMMGLLKQFYSEKRAEKIFNKWLSEVEMRANGIKTGQNIYTLMNEDYNESLMLIGGSNYDRLIAQGEWIEKNQDFFGKDILDVGCLNGLMTCFIARLFPESKVVGIDNNKPAIINAKKLAKTLRLDNAKFVFVPFSRIDGTYDTVFTSLFLHENYNIVAPSTYNTMNNEEKIDYWYGQINPTIEKISSVLNENGTAICFERYYYNIALAGLLKAFERNGLDLSIDKVAVSKYAMEEGIASYILKKRQTTEGNYQRYYEALKNKYGERELLK